MGKDKRDFYQGAQNFQAGHAGSIPVTRSKFYELLQLITADALLELGTFRLSWPGALIL